MMLIMVKKTLILQNKFQTSFFFIYKTVFIDSTKNVFLFLRIENLKIT